MILIMAAHGGSLKYALLEVGMNASVHNFLLSLRFFVGFLPWTSIREGQEMGERKGRLAAKGKAQYM